MTEYDDFVKAADVAAETAYKAWIKCLDARDKAFAICQEAAEKLIDIETEIRAQYENGGVVSADLKSREESARAAFETAHIESYHTRARSEKTADFHNKVSAARNVVKIMMRGE
jgi:hypothetical protein